MNTEYIKETFYNKLGFFIKEFNEKPEYSYKKDEDGELFRIVLTNKVLQKRIRLSFLHGVNIDQKEYNRSNFRVEYIGENKSNYKWTWFSLKDFCSYRKKEQVNHYYKYDQTVDERTTVFFEFIKDALLNDGLMDILLSKEWHVIPIDMSPYK